MPIRRLGTLLHYRFGLIVVAAMLSTLGLVIALNGDIGVWALGAVTVLLLSIGAISDSAVDAYSEGPEKPDRWLPDYNGFNRFGLFLSFILMLEGSLIGVLPGRLSEDATALPLELVGAIAGWILLRRALVLLSAGITKMPFMIRKALRIQPVLGYGKSCSPTA